MKKKASSHIRVALLSMVVLLVIVTVSGYFQLIAPVSSESGLYVNVDTDDNVDSVTAKYSHATDGRHVLGFRVAAMALGYASHMHPGHYVIDSGEGVLHFVHKLRKAMQTPIRLTIPAVRTVERLAAELDKKLMLDSLEIIQALSDSTVCAQYGYDTANILCLFIPNTYECYWTMSVEKLLTRMKRESDAFWNDERKAKAEEAGLTPREVIVLASIVDEETSNEAEKPTIAGLYLNRLHKGMRLQADPTVKFALGQFSLRRIYSKMLLTDSPYNTYMYAGLPPGPIRIPTLSGINAVLHYEHSNYIFMCAKEDFSGTHNFASTLAEHALNARKYSDALNAHGVE